MPPGSTRQPFNAAYYSQLIGEARSRYEEKVRLCDGVDPYTLRPGTDTTSNTSSFPEVSHGDIVNYLVFSTNFVTLGEMKAFKSMEAHNYFTSGWVKSLSAKELRDHKVIVLAEVNHSQRLRDHPLQVWTLCRRDGAVLAAHCSCMAGVGEACSHIGACLFAVETGIHMKNATSCTQRENVWLPAYVERVQYKRLRDIDFTSSRGKMQRLEQEIANSPVGTQEKKRIEIPAPSSSDLSEFYESLKDTSTIPALFSLLPEYCDSFKEPEQTKPSHLRGLYSEGMLADSLETLVEKADEFLASYNISADVVRAVEASTRHQSSSQEWFRHRAGRVTASVMKSVCHTKTEKPSVSLLKSICYPEKQSVQTAATRWGLAHEADALKAYNSNEGSKHQDFECRRSGLHLSSKYPFIGATPDAMVSCSCCGKGVVELKCPYVLRDATEFTGIKTCLTESNGVKKLQKDHAYFYQIQTQMCICEVDFCDFVVWAPGLYHVERIVRDENFCMNMFDTAREFFRRAILPELFGHYFTRRVQDEKEQVDNAVYCFCKGPESGKMIACDNSACQHKWFHFACVSLKCAPKTKQWYCPTCRKEKEN